MEALESGAPLERVFMVKGSASDVHRNIAKLTRVQGIPLKLVPPEKLQRLTRKNHQGVIAFTSPVAFYHLENLLPQIFENGESPLILLLDGVTDVRNLGAIARSAECFGVHAIVVPMQHSAPINGEAIKSSAGALLNIPICRTNDVVRTAKYLNESGVEIVGCSEKGDTDFRRLKYENPACLVMGAEDIGISEDLWALCDKRVAIPMKGKTASLNVSVAAGILLAEMAGQRL
ncbi:MAG: 23S rRNA (guanosine(2251)-2'-O)-methyltransferase RlmB [Cryomorphaceae bacterium]|nr:23S rRNA (guanosine(2251)-2'-O)-methyltransferase RlmB [Cryomorphaceae bacterium]